MQIDVTIWDFDPENKFLQYDMVDEFNHVFVDLPGTAGRPVTITGTRPKSPTK